MNYCYAPDVVQLGPMPIPKTWADPVTGISYSNFNQLGDPDLLVLKWYPYVENDPGQPGPEYNKTYSDFSILATTVERDVIWVEWTQQQKDFSTPTTITELQREALSLAEQTQGILAQDTNRRSVGSDPIIPDADITDTEAYLKGLWDTMDGKAAELPDASAAVRQAVDDPRDSSDRAVIRRIRQTWNVPDDIYGLSYTLYTSFDASGMSVKIHDAAGTYLYTMSLAEQSPGVWYAETQSGSWGQHLELKEFEYVLFEGTDISQMRALTVEEEEQVFDVKWRGVEGEARGRGRRK